MRSQEEPHSAFNSGRDFASQPNSPRVPAAQVSPVQHHPVITRIIFLKRPTTIRDVLPFFLIILLYYLTINTVLTVWKKFNKKSYEIFLFILVFIFPPLVMFAVGDIIFFGIWLVQVLFLMVCLRKVVKRPLDSKVPGIVYKTFKRLFVSSTAFILVGNVLLVCSFLFYNSKTLQSLRLLIYAVYIALLSREAARNMCHIMARNTGFYSQEGVPGRQESEDICMLCTAEFTDSSKNVLTIGCGHSYHKECIKGWSVIGQNSFCPYCKHGIDNAFTSVELWEQTEYVFRPLVNLLRSFITYFIIILAIFISRKKISDW